LRESRQGLGLVIVDNGSDDGSEDYLRARLPDATVIQTGRNIGFSGGCNVGIRHALAAGADCVLLANSDAVVAPDCVERLREALERPGVGIAGPAVLREDGRIESAGISYSTCTGRMSLRRFGEPADGRGAGVERVDAVSAAMMLVRREVFDAIGLFAEEFFYSFEDLDFCLRARAARFDVVVVGSARATHRGSASIGARSARRVYFATRNHLLVASRSAAGTRPRRAILFGSVVLLNLAHAAVRSDVPAFSGVMAVLRGTRDHLRGRYGSDA
jgi:GT2 family glycosyltransferase